MKKLMLLALLVTACCMQAAAQNYYLNLEKYWWYRYRLVNDFMKIGTAPGESIPCPNIYLGNDYDKRTDANHLHWGDATVSLGHYIMVLATEWKLLHNSGLPTERTEYELYYALKAFDRLDRDAEERCRDFGATEDGQNIHPQPGDFNGFWVRDDVPNDFIRTKNTPVGSGTRANNWDHFNRPGRCYEVEDIISDGTARSDYRMGEREPWNHPSLLFPAQYPGVTRYPQEGNMDHYVMLFKGMALVVYLVPASVQYNGESLVQLAQDALIRTSVYVAHFDLPRKNLWKIYNPVSGRCIYGNNASNPPQCGPGGALSYAISDGVGSALEKLQGGGAGNTWTTPQYNQIQIIDHNTSTAHRLVFQMQRYWAGIPCSSDRNLFAATMATIGQGWGGYSTRAVWNSSMSCDLQFPDLPLIYRILHGGPRFRPEAFPHFKDSYETRLDAAPRCGVRNDQTTAGSKHDWSGPDWISEGKKRGQGMWHATEHPGLDYMSVFNLYLLNNSKYAGTKGYTNPYYRENLQQTYPYFDVKAMAYKGYYSTPASFRYLQYLSTTSHVAQGGGAVYRSGQQIVLLPGFKADSGSHFLAYVEDYKCCNGSGDNPFALRTTGDINMQDYDSWAMDTTEDMRPFVPYDIPQAEETREITRQEMVADSIDLYHQILATGDAEVIGWLKENFGPPVGRATDNGSVNGLVSVYPNPNRGTFTVQVEGEGTYEVRLVDAAGREAYRGTIRQRVLQVELRLIPAGTYVVRVSGKDLQYAQKLIVVR